MCIFEETIKQMEIMKVSDLKKGMCFEFNGMDVQLIESELQGRIWHVEVLGVDEHTEFIVVAKDLLED